MDNQEGMAYLSVFACQAIPASEQPLAALRIHGFYSDMKAAQAQVERFASEQPDVQSYIVEECMRWVTVADPVKGTAMEEEEIRAPENDDRENGRMGSVCDLRRPEGQPATSDQRIFENPDKPKGGGWKKKQVSDQKGQLDELLRGHDPRQVDTMQQYSAVREKMALLRAFRRKLLTLQREGHTKSDDAKGTIRDLEGRHPEYRDRFREHYGKALKESGIREENVGFIRLLDADV